MYGCFIVQIRMMFCSVIYILDGMGSEWIGCTIFTIYTLALPPQIQINL